MVDQLFIGRHSGRGRDGRRCSGFAGSPVPPPVSVLRCKQTGGDSVVIIDCSSEPLTMFINCICGFN